MTKTSLLEKIANTGKAVAKYSKKALDTTKEFLKDNYKSIVLGVGYAAGVGSGAYLVDKAMVGEAEAGQIQIYNKGKAPSVIVNGDCVYIQHKKGSLEGTDGEDVLYTPSTNKLHIYSHNNPTNTDLLQDSRDSNSMSSFSLPLTNDGFSGTTTNYLRFILNDSNDFEWKNIFLSGTNESDTVVADIKYVINSNGKTVNGISYGDFTLGTLSGTAKGIYDTRKIKFFNHADLNRDGKVNIIDYTKFANEFGKDNTSNPNRFGANVGSNPSDLGAYADIDRSGAVDNLDLIILGDEWLWDANDPNTW
ncbi:MAG: dockerin type I domain-containing protein [Candidatus Pacearchaeota archaeon]|jgi:hypothetical protein